MVTVINDPSQGKEAGKKNGKTETQNVAVNTRRLSRRDFLRLFGLGVVLIPLRAVACTVSTRESSASKTPTQPLVPSKENQPVPTDPFKKETQPVPTVASTKGVLPTQANIPTLTEISKPTELPKLCEADPVAELFTNGLEKSRTVPVLSQGGYDITFAGQDVIVDITSNISNGLSKIVESGTNSVSNVIVPEYIRPEDVINGIKQFTDIPIPFEITPYQKDMDMGKPNTYLAAVHAGEAGQGGWDTALWSGAKLETRSSDNSYRINGYLYKVVQGDKGPELRMVPAQRISGRKADIAIVKDCKPSVVAVTGDYQVEAVLDPNVDIIKDPDHVWIANPNPERAQVKMVEFDRVDMEINGKVVPFTINTEEGEADIRKTWSKWGIKSLNVNPNLENPEEKFSKLMTALLWQISQAGYTDVSYEDFMKDPKSYPINSIPGTPTFTLDEVTAINYTFIDFDDPRLKGPEIGPKAGYQLNNGTLTVYGTTWPDDTNFNQVISGQFDKYMGNGYEQSVGNYMAPFLFRVLLLQNRDILEKQQIVINISEYGYPKKNESSDAYIKRMFKQGFWMAEIENQNQ